MRIQALGIVAAVTLFAACSDDTTATPAATDAPTTVATTVPATTMVPVDTTVPASTDPPATDAPTTTEALLPSLPVGQPLTDGTSYRMARSVIGRSLQFTNPTDGAFGVSGPGGFFVAADQAGTEPLLGVFDLMKSRAFTDALIDLGTATTRPPRPGALADADAAALTAATETPATDYLAYFAALPGVEAGEVTTTEFAGHSAKVMTWRFGAFDGGYPCFGSARGNCVVTLWFEVGVVASYWTGDAGTTYVLDIDGTTVVVEVPDRPGAKEAADSLVIGD